MIGIYKITSPSGNVYIGQSIDIKKRWARYRDKKDNYRHYSVYRSFEKYGVANHIFEVLHELPKDVSADVINEYEIFYIQQYKDCGFVLLNIKEGGRGGAHSEETKNKLRIASTGNKNMLGKKHSEEALKRMSEGRKGYAAWNKGKAWSEEVKKKMYKYPKGNIPWNKNLPYSYKIHSEEHKKKMEL